MRVYLYRNVWSGHISFITQHQGDGYYGSRHAETGLPYGDSWHELHAVYEVPEAYEAEGGDIMVPSGNGWTPWGRIWPDKPNGARKIA